MFIESLCIPEMDKRLNVDDFKVNRPFLELFVHI